MAAVAVVGHTAAVADTAAAEGVAGVSMAAVPPILAGATAAGLRIEALVALHTLEAVRLHIRAAASTVMAAGALCIVVAAPHIRAAVEARTVTVVVVTAVARPTTVPGTLLETPATGPDQLRRGASAMLARPRRAVPLAAEQPTTALGTRSEARALAPDRLRRAISAMLARPLRAIVPAEQPTKALRTRSETPAMALGQMRRATSAMLGPPRQPALPWHPGPDFRSAPAVPGLETPRLATSAWAVRASERTAHDSEGLHPPRQTLAAQDSAALEAWADHAGTAGGLAAETVHLAEPGAVATTAAGATGGVAALAGAA